MITALWIFCLFYALVGLIIGITAFLVTSDKISMKFTKTTNQVANVIVSIIVGLFWPVWVAAWLHRFI